jgi:hypothetical protein
VPAFSERWRRRPCLVLVLATLGLGCDDPPAAPRTANAAGFGGSAGAAQAIAPSQGARLPVATAPEAPGGCRVMSFTGSVRAAGGALIRKGQRLTGDEGLILPEAARLHLKHAVSGREWSVLGPARLLACVAGQEELVLGEGRLLTEQGVGARPGAEVLIGTPFGSIRYLDARAELVVNGRELRLSASSGEAWLAPPGSEETPELRARGPQLVRRTRAQRPTLQAAIEACARAAASSESQASALLQPSEQALGQRAAAHVRARQHARSSCAIATAALLSDEQGAEQRARWLELDQHRASWQRIPVSRR